MHATESVALLGKSPGEHVINVSKFAFCGIVACVSMVAGCVVDDPSDIATEDEALVLNSEDDDVVTVYPEQDTETEEMSAAGEIGILTTISFHRTCNGASFDVRADGAVVRASASSCRRRNGSWTGPRSWRGVCFGNVANNDGNIGCNN
jgi:hypothetical protein